MNENLLQVKSEITKVLRGKEDCIDQILCCMLAGGHILLEDIPGVGKTTMALAFSRVLSLSCSRVQFTPDVLPSDITGFTMYNRESNRFEYRDGAANCQLLLAGETTAKDAYDHICEAAFAAFGEENCITGKLG